MGTEIITITIIMTITITISKTDKTIEEMALKSKENKTTKA